MTEQKKFIVKESRFPFLPVIFLLLVVAASIGLYVYNMRLSHVNQSLQEKIEARKNNITELQKNKKLQTYEILKSQEKVISRLERESNIPLIISKFKKLQSDSGFTFEGFDFSDGKLHTSVQFSPSTDKKAHEQMIRFLDNYRKHENKKKTGQFFDLSFVESVEGMAITNFDIELTLQK